MSIVFRIATDLDDRIVPPAEITARQLAAFRARLAAEGDRTGETLLHCRGGDEELSDNFEARVCPFALATLARLFDYATDVITVLEEAQFRARRVKVWHTSPNGPIRMRVAETSDRALELDLPATLPWRCSKASACAPTVSVKSRSKRSGSGWPILPCNAA